MVTELYYPEETSTGYYLTRIAEGLAGDFEVRVLCGQPNYLARGLRAPAREQHRGVEIYRVRGTTLDKNIIFFRLINMLTLGISVLCNALKRFRRGDRVLVVTTPPNLPFLTALAALMRGAGYTLLIHDNYPEILIAAGKTREDSLLVRLLNHLNRWLYKYAQKIIVVGRDMRELLEKKTAGLNLRLETIPNWAELERVEPAPRAENTLLRELGLQDKFIFLYAGNMGYPNDLKSLVICAEMLAERGVDEIHFIFLGAGVKKNWLKRRVERKKLVNITVLDPRPRSEQINFLNACDVALVSLVKKMWGVSMPSRTYNILAAGKPILALTEKSSELARVIKEDGVGWAVPPDRPEILLEKIIEISQKKGELERFGLNARNAALEKYSVEAALDRYRSVLADDLMASDNERK